jgi:hypothetical protein
MEISENNMVYKAGAGAATPKEESYVREVLTVGILLQVTYHLTACLSHLVSVELLPIRDELVSRTSLSCIVLCFTKSERVRGSWFGRVA